jgi:uncharacterized protein (TIGR02145 family)
MVAVLSSFGQVINIKGKVIYENGNPAAGVIATLRDLYMSDTTGSDGIYHLLLPPSSVGAFRRITESPYYSGGMLHFALVKRQAVTVDIYDLNGKHITRLFNSNLDKGEYSINPHFGMEFQANSMFIAKLKTGNRSSCHRFFNFKVNSFSRLMKREGRNSTELLKTAKAAGIDELQLSLDGKLLTTFEMYSYTATMPDYIIINLPYIPSLPSPPNNAENLETEIILSWQGGDPNGDAVSYDVFLDTVNPPVSKVSKVTNITSVRVANLKSAMTYYWKIVASDGENTTSGPVWKFSTKNLLPNWPSNPSPANGARDVPTDVILSWDGGDPDRDDIVTYDVLIGSQNPPSVQAAYSTSETSHPVSGLDSGIVYYWRVLASDGKATIFGPVWSFTTTDMLTDLRDGKKYKKVTIGTQTWMAENLKFTPSSGNSWCYDNNPANCDTYGRLYDWNTSTDNYGNGQDICPFGWNLPSDAEWKILEMYLGMSKSEADNAGWRGTDEGKELKSSDLWDGTNDYGFNALPAGYYEGGPFRYLGSYALFWTSAPGGGGAMYRFLESVHDDVNRAGTVRAFGLSVRCLQD